MRRLVLLAVLLLAACGGGTRGPESVVRAWSKALNAGDAEAAGALFAPNARVVQGNAELVLHDASQARAWNDGLPCSGKITKLQVKGEVVTAWFLLGNRPGHACDAPGAKAEAVIRVHDGKIALWHQIATENAPPVV